MSSVSFLSDYTSYRTRDYSSVTGLPLHGPEETLFCTPYSDTTQPDNRETSLPMYSRGTSSTLSDGGAGLSSRQPESTHVVNIIKQ